MYSLVARHFCADKHFYRLFKKIFGVVPRNVDLYKLALVHRSASVVLEDGGLVNNERLEFLGDAILQAISSDMLFLEYPQFSEGDLTRLRSKIVSRESLGALAKKIELDKEIVSVPAGLYKGQRAIVGDVMESVIGALYLDKGYDVTRKVVVKLIQQHLDIDKILNTEEDFKSRVLEWGQKEHKNIEFVVVENKNTIDQDVTFEASLTVDGKVEGFGVGRTKKMGEQRAAKQFFEQYLS